MLHLRCTALLLGVLLLAGSPPAMAQDSLKVVIPAVNGGVRFVPPRPGARRIVIVPAPTRDEPAMVPAPEGAAPASAPTGISAAQLQAWEQALEAQSRSLEAAVLRAERAGARAHANLADSIDSLRRLLMQLQRLQEPVSPGAALSTARIEPVDSLFRTPDPVPQPPEEQPVAEPPPAPILPADPLPVLGPDEPVVDVIERIMLDTGLFRAVQVVFELDSQRLMPHALPVLDAIAEVLARNPELGLSVVGHTDSIGADGYNLELSQRRAEAVVEYLSSKGVSPARLTAEGRGESEPIADNRFSTGRVLNRRVEFVVR